MATAIDPRANIDEQSTADEMAAAFEAIGSAPEEWCHWNNLHVAFRQLLDRYIAEPKEYPAGKYSGRGIVIGAGGAKFFACAFCCVCELRRLGCELPVEFWHLGDGEFDREMQRAAETLAGVTVVDAAEVAKSLPKPPRRLAGWELKPFAVVHSAFEEVLYLDADVIPARDPTYLFDCEPYVEFGSHFWPDLPPAARKEWLPATAWHNVGLDYRDEVDFESGQFLVNKREVWAEILTTLWLNERSDYVYKWVFGDKSTYHLAWRKLGRKYAISPFPCGWKWPCILQFDAAGKLVFQHACQGKEKIVAGDQLACLLDPRAPTRAAAELGRRWSGAIYDYNASNESEQLAAEAIEGLYEYDRLGTGARNLRLDSRGRITEGAAACEKRWSVQIEGGEVVLTIVGEAHKAQDVGMMRLRLDPADGIWRGRWLWHDRGKVELRPIGCADLAKPPWWRERPTTWDSQIFDMVVNENEYKLPRRFRPGSVVVDVGAHIGSFSFAALQRGAARVHAYEADADNFELASQNLALVGRRAEVMRAAIWSPGVETLDFHPSADSTNTGGGGVVTGGSPRPGELVAAVALDAAIEAAAEGFGRVAILKLDCEGAEFPALLNAERLDLVDFVMGEIHEYDVLPTSPAFCGHNRHTAGLIQRRLESFGFQVTIERDTDTFCHFWAGRPGGSKISY